MFVYVFVRDAMFLIEMGITCSCDKSARYKYVILSRAESCLASAKTKTRRSKARRQNEQNSYETKPREGDFKKAVKDSVDIDPTEGEDLDEPAVPQIKEIKVLPPIRNRTNTMAHISYTPNRVWGGSVNSFLGKSSWN